ncbi:MAG: peptidoglycan-binding protein [Candidatus Pacebacteria bacterium]|nr:peptidoglycan-binding protein [Candidatus Paceibacterota bacterium]
MKTYMYLSAVLLTFLAPLWSHAQSNTQSFPQCPDIYINLSFGSRDQEVRGQVSALQRYLTDFYNLPAAELVTGYFGARTRENVRRFQCETMSLCSGDEDSNGYGAVGPRTRTAIATRCSSGVSNAGASLERSTSVTEDSVPIPSPRLIGTSSGGAGSVATPTSEDDDFSCTLGGVTIPDGSSALFYAIQSVQYPATCASVSQARTCSAGALFGQDQYQYPSCSVSGEVRPGAGSSSTYSENSLVRYYTDTPSGGASTQPPALVSGSGVTCSYNGTMYLEGRSIWVPQSCGTLEASGAACGYYMNCERGVWVNRSTVPGGGAASCTFENTREGASCGGQYHCAFGVSGHTWSATPCTSSVR